MDQNETWHGGRHGPRPHCVRWLPSSPKKGAQPHSPPEFSAHVYCGQTAGWIKMPLGLEVCLDQSDIVLDVDPLQKGTQSPNFLPTSIAAKRLDKPRCHLVWRYASTRRHCVRWGPSSSPNFRPMSVVAKRLNGLICHLVRRQGRIIHEAGKAEASGSGPR